MASDTGGLRNSSNKTVDLKVITSDTEVRAASGYSDPHSVVARLIVNENDATSKPRLFEDAYEELELVFDPRERILWYYMRPKDRPSFTHTLLRDIRRLQLQVAETFEGAKSLEDTPLRYLVATSALPQTFNLGGDLRLLGSLVRAKDRFGLEDYARACIDVLFGNMVALDLPLVTVSLVRGYALGGGFEAAMSSNVLIAEEQAKFGLPEVLFNLFPGMGAYSLLARRIGQVEAERMIVSGKTYSAGEMHEMGIVDVLAAEGEGERKLYEFVGQRSRRFNSHLAIYQARKRYAKVTHEELNDIAAIWVNAALNLSTTDLRRIDRLASSQDRL
ncbi:MAG: crotonase/enoyl-CoA hydratase family protein [Alphaproteobacteria bacterium]|nr:crotonase/enoyl-CoA hydratase family protein [Alphaproteobacteria bacterium]